MRLFVIIAAASTLAVMPSVMQPHLFKAGSFISAQLHAQADEATTNFQPAVTQPDDGSDDGADDDAARLAFDIFTAFFSDEDNPIPADVRVLGVRLLDGALTVNVSEEILAFGGNENERLLVAALIEAARGVPGASHLTLLIEGESKPLSEGRVVESIPLY
jgi:hypothetical protein